MVKAGCRNADVGFAIFGDGNFFECLDERHTRLRIECKWRSTPLERYFGILKSRQNFPSVVEAVLVAVRDVTLRVAVGSHHWYYSNIFDTSCSKLRDKRIRHRRLSRTWHARKRNEHATTGVGRLAREKVFRALDHIEYGCPQGVHL
jgi:hypothetical protein